MSDARQARPLVIAHRGASGYLPEHTLPAKALAFAMGADYLEQDVVAARDGTLVVSHDVALDLVSNVAEIFPDRARNDGRYYVIDFDIDELRRLTLNERRRAPGEGARYPLRYPLDGGGGFRIVTLDEELEFVAGLNRASGRHAGVYPEIKAPAWHREQGFDLTAAVVATLARHGYDGPDDRIYLQCFDAGELRRAREALGCRLPVVQLLDEDADVSAAGLAAIAAYADGIGPSLSRCVPQPGAAGEPFIDGGLVADAQRAGLVVHPWTFRADDLPPGVANFNDLLELFLLRLRVDGVFTDFPDLVAEFVTHRVVRG